MEEFYDYLANLAVLSTQELAFELDTWLLILDDRIDDDHRAQYAIDRIIGLDPAVLELA